MKREQFGRWISKVAASDWPLALIGLLPVIGVLWVLNQ